ncbi:MAG: helix-turn-helix transcriptional regulator [Catenibacterium mitsuokai]|nr:helix-turn-helix transcriptional regulator [Catenibacterium mitsuokai]MCI6075986.1 helix-turn-helix transcriptional regulator [Catenibacterium mitsuokai]
MQISYNKLWKKMIDQNINRTQLKERAKISTNAVAKLGKNEPVSMDTLDKICKVFGCNIGDVMEFINDNNDTYESGGINE